MKKTLTRLAKLSLELCENPDFVPSRLKELQDILQLLQYHSMSKSPGDIKPPARIDNVKCSVEDCTCNSTQPDACILRFGNEWRCRDHHPPLKSGQIRPVGWTDTETARNEVEERRSKVLEKVAPNERYLINRNIVYGG